VLVGDEKSYLNNEVHSGFFWFLFFVFGVTGV
jgi:hypothetical protein